MVGWERRGLAGLHSAQKNKFSYAICFLPFYSVTGFAVARLVKIVVECFFLTSFQNLSTFCLVFPCLLFGG